MVGTVTADTFLNETDYDEFNKAPSDFKAKRLVLFLFFSTSVITTALAGKTRMMYKNYWQGLLGLGLISALLIAIINNGHFGEWKIDASKTIFTESSNEQLYPTFSLFFLAGSIAFSTGSSRYYVLFVTDSRPPSAYS